MTYSAWAARLRVPLGFGFAAAYLLVSLPTLSLLIAGGFVALLGLAVRAVAAGYIEKSLALATAGPFARTRNPLYLGSLMLGAGFMIAGGSWVIAMVFIGLFLLIYLPVMRAEENFLRQKFGPEYDDYARVVPLFLPAVRRYGQGTGSFQWVRYQANREYNAALGYVAIVIFLIIKLVLRSHGVQVNV
ncbi:MAG TPA: isoprenylcysteine carboxylmethyltransferase family protein [Terriglobia bacterium]|nr:isoprenylcysteine carboxylmethyltransferase family protein [Terriglobia bacterium]